MNAHQKTADAIEEVLSRARSLASQHVRHREGCFWLEGVRQFVQAYDARLTFEAVIYSPILLKSDLVEMLVRRLGAQGVRRVKVTPEQFRSVSTTPRASGIAAIARQRWIPLSQVEPKRGLCWLILEEIRSPGNLGTILRTAEAVDASGIIFVGPRCDPFAPEVVRASMGGICRLPLVRTTHEQLGQWSQANGVQFVGLSPDADYLWSELPAAGAIGLMIGEERNGISTQLRELCNTMVRLPMAGHADSLNVGVAAGVMMYELVRRSLQ
ncbi:MAG: RNA methyltransferase [Planctomycetia bacterium]|nr:RNA methyltransferase [Planctomycetia bacterium]